MYFFILNTLNKNPQKAPIKIEGTKKSASYLDSKNFPIKKPKATVTGII